MQLSSCPAHYKMALTSLLLPLCSVGNFQVAGPALLPAAQKKWATRSHLWEAAKLQQCLAVSAAERLLLQSRQTEECREKQTDQPTQGCEQRPGMHRPTGWSESLCKLAAGN